MERLVVFLASYARILVATKEGTFAEGRAEAQTTLRECDEFVTQLERFFDAHDATFETTGSDLHRLHGIFKFMTHLFAAAEEMATAEELGFQGRIAEYVQYLRRALRHHRQAVDTPLSGAEADKLIQPLRTLSVASIRLLQKRVTNFELRAKGEVPYLFPPSGKKVFIIHGHNEARRLERATLLKDDFGLDPVVLVDELSGMRPVLEKFVDAANPCGYAIALLTRDDPVTKGELSYSQARPNVLFEAGWFLGRFGPNRLVLIMEKGTHLPSDLGGVYPMEFVTKIEEVYRDLRRTLSAAGLIGSPGAG
jgi:predicted nucleotide-binding protein